jgi:hypothetical protein
MKSRAKNITVQELQAIVNALPKRGEFNCQTIKAIARSIVPRLTFWQLEGLAYDLKIKQLISPGHNRNWYKILNIPVTPNLPLDCPQEITFAPIAPTLRQDCAEEKQYTKSEVIAAFKVYYVKEFVRMDDRAYLLAGLLESAL